MPASTVPAGSGKTSAAAILMMFSGLFSAIYQQGNATFNNLESAKVGFICS
jgi:hypothetical protein